MAAFEHDDHDCGQHGNHFHSLVRAPLRRHSANDNALDEGHNIVKVCMTSRSISQPESNREFKQNCDMFGLNHNVPIRKETLPNTWRNHVDQGSTKDINAQIHREILLNPFATYRRRPKQRPKLNVDDGADDSIHYKRRSSGPDQNSVSSQPFNAYATYRRAPLTYPRLDSNLDDSKQMPMAIFPQFNARSIDLNNDRNVLIELESERNNEHKRVEKQSSVKHLFNIKLHDIKKQNIDEYNMASCKQTSNKGLFDLEEMRRGILKFKKHKSDTSEAVSDIKHNDAPENDGVADETRDHKEPLIYCKLVTKYPKTSFLLTFSGHLMIAILTIILLLSGFDLFPTDFETLPISDWNVPWLKRDFAWRFRDEYAGRYVRKLYMQGMDKWYRSMAYGRANMVLYYDTGGDGNMFEKSKLKEMEYIESQLTSMPNYDQFCEETVIMKCHKPQSILRFFDGTYASVDPVFNDPNFANIPKVLHAAKTNNRTKGEFAYFLSKNHHISATVAYASVTRTVIPMGYPLQFGEKVEAMENKMEYFLVNSFKPSVEQLKNEVRKDFRLIYFSYLLFRHDIVRQIVYDMVLALGSIMFIYVFIVYHTKSLWISTLAVFSILTSFLGANMIYRIVLDFRYFGFFHVITIFIILGIGADDLFVFLDVWKNTGFSTYPSLAHRLSDAFRQSVFSMFITSLTTCVAFFSSAFSPLLAPKSFGIFAGILVIVNYVSVMMYFPTVVVIHHMYFENWSWPCLTFICNKLKTLKTSAKEEAKDSNKETKQQWLNTDSLFDDNTAVNSDGNFYPVVGTTNPAFKSDIEDDYGFINLKSATDENSLSTVNVEIPSISNTLPLEAVDYGATCMHDDHISKIKVETINHHHENENGENIKKKKILVRFFRDYYFKFVTHWLIKWVILVLLLAMVIFFSYSASRLETENEQVQFYRKSHNYGKALDLDFHDFVPNKADRNVVVYIVWGLKERDMSNCHFSDGRCLGVEQFDDSFNPNTPEAQLALKKFCDRLLNFSSYEIDHFKIRRDFTSGVPEIKCFPDSLNRFLQCCMATAKSHPDYISAVLLFTGSLGSSSSIFVSPLKDVGWIPISYWLNDGFRLRNRDQFHTFHTLIGEGISEYSTPLKTDFSIFYGNRIIYMGIQVNLTLGTFTSGYPEGKPAMDRWESFVHDMMKQMPPGMQNGFQLTKDFWHNISVQKSMADNAIFGILVGILLALPILTLATQNLVIGSLATFSMCCSTVCVVGVIPLAGWKLGILESLNMCMVVGLTVDYVVHLAEGYHLSARAERKQRVQDMLEVVGISVFSGACSTLGASLFMFFAQIQFIIRFGIFMFCTIGFSLLFSLGLFTILMGILGPSGNTGDLKHIYGMILRKCRRRHEGSNPIRRQTSVEESVQ